MKKWIFVFGMFVAFMAYAETSGTCGPRSGAGTDEDPYVYADNCQWTLDDNGKLTITGRGNMGSWRISEVPWYNQRHLVSSIKIEEGITSIGYNAFYHFINLENIELPTSLATIQPGGLEFCPKLTKIELPENIQILPEAFESSGFNSIVIPRGASLDEKAFYSDNPDGGTTLTEIYCPPELQEACARAVSYRADAAKVITYEKTPDGHYFADGKWYTNLGDMGTTNHIKKRIYTLDEANQVAGETNTVSIRYR